MSKEIEKFFVKRLSAILTDYVKDFSQNNVAKVSKYFIFPKKLWSRPSKINGLLNSTAFKIKKM